MSEKFAPTPGRIYKHDKMMWPNVIQEGIRGTHWRWIDENGWGRGEENIPGENFIEREYRDVTLDFLFAGKYEVW